MADKLEIKPSSISTMIDRLVQNDIVSREYGIDDRRNVLVSLTAKGREMLKHDIQISKEVVLRYLNRLEPEELESLTAIFEKLADFDHS